MSTEYYRREAGDGEAYVPGGTKFSLRLEVGLPADPEDPAVKGLRVPLSITDGYRERGEAEEVDDATFDRLCRLEQLNLLRRIAVAMERVTRVYTEEEPGDG